MKILLIEDHPASRRNLARMVEKRGHEVTACASVEEAEVALAQDTFPFLILDWMLPGKSGIELCRILRAQPEGDELFILLITARAEPEDLEEALAAGANDYLTKPFDLRQMTVRLSVAESYIQRLQERREARLALLESAQRMTDILERTSDGFFALDRDWNFLHLNARAQSMLGHERADLIGRNFWETSLHLRGSLVERNYRQVLARQIAVEFEVTEGNPPSIFEIHAYPSGDGVSVFLRNITARRRSEEERLTMSKLESLGTLAGGIAHDLNNILTVILGNIGLAQAEAPASDTSLPSFLAKAGHAAQQAVRLSSQLLTFSKGGAPHKRVASIVDIVLHAAEIAFHGSNLRAEIEIDEHLGETEIDVAQVEQVIVALLMNAREAMPHGGAVHVSAENFPVDSGQSLPLAPGSYVKISIADGGPGVPAELTTKIFDPYFTTKPTSSGLGLAICHSIIKKHGGYLHLEHNLPGGAAFAFYLPKTRSAQEEVFSPNGMRDPFEGKRILVMDDEADIRELLTQLLSTMGCEVTAVPDGSAATRVYEQAAQTGEGFQAVILDATIVGGVGGVETIKELRAFDPEVRAIVCSGYSDAAAIAQFISYGFRGALSKPFTREELAVALHNALGLGQESEISTSPITESQPRARKAVSSSSPPTR